MTGEMTRSVHAGNDSSGPSVRTPITMANSYHLPPEPEAMSWSGTEQLFYTRNTGANQVALQIKLAALEEADDAAGLLTEAVRALAPAGRMALSNYLLQSLVCAWLFTGYGLGGMGQVSPPACVAIASAQGLAATSTAIAR